eukprot:scaffold161606_cov48-Prasinocladus_malaysianus.AAC.1
MASINNPAYPMHCCIHTRNRLKLEGCWGFIQWYIFSSYLSYTKARFSPIQAVPAGNKHSLSPSLMAALLLQSRAMSRMTSSQDQASSAGELDGRFDRLQQRCCWWRPVNQLDGQLLGDDDGDRDCIFELITYAS